MTGQQRERRPHGALFEREQEIEAAKRAVDDLGARIAAGEAVSGSLFLYSGEAGAGKTAFLGELRSILAEYGGCTVLQARGSASAETVPFHIVRQLLQPALASMSPERREELLGGWQDSPDRPSASRRPAGPWVTRKACATASTGWSPKSP